MPTLTIDNQTITVPDGTTVLQAARQVGIEIPALCHLEGRPACTSCLVCVVRINGASRLAPSCATRVVDGMVVESESDAVRAARRTALELLLGDHTGDCVGPCESACPAHLDIPLMLRHLTAGDTGAARGVIARALPFPATLSYICPAPCERGCRRAAVDGAVAIRHLHRVAAETVACLPASGKHVAIVGAGPTGLSAIYTLQQAGHACTLFDANAQAGGGMRDAQAPAEVLAAEVAQILALGATWQPDSYITPVQLDALRRQFDAVLLAVGQGSDFDLTADRKTHQTATPGIFAASGSGRMAVRAVAAGQSAASAICRYLAGEAIIPERAPFSVRMGKVSDDEMALFLAGANPEPRTDPIIPEREAARCLHCDCRQREGCKLRDAAIAYSASPTALKGERRIFSQDATHPQIIFEPGKCITCGLCVQLAADAGDQPGLAFTERGFNTQIAVPFDAALADALPHCALNCARTCPTGALAVKE